MMEPPSSSPCMWTTQQPRSLWVSKVPWVKRPSLALEWFLCFAGSWGCGIGCDAVPAANPGPCCSCFCTVLLLPQLLCCCHFTTAADISKVQDDEVGDGTTSVVVTAGELLREAEQLVAQKVHPMTIIAGKGPAQRSTAACLSCACGLLWEGCGWRPDTRTVRACVRDSRQSFPHRSTLGTGELRVLLAWV